MSDELLVMALKSIAEFPVTDARNMDAQNMRRIAASALLLAHTSRPEGGTRVLMDTDPYCPSCGHNRDKSSVSSIDHQDGTRSCQLCGTRWLEVPSTMNSGPT